VKIQAGQAVNFVGKAADTDGFVSTDSWFFPAGKPATSSVLSPGAIVFSSSGIFTASLTTVDNEGFTIQAHQYAQLQYNPTNWA
jgi:hypothetical protein